MNGLWTCGELAAWGTLRKRKGIAKPERRIYELACERLGVQPTEMIFLDDAERCVAAAHDCGIHAILFQNTAQAIADVEAVLRAHCV
jgi:HAD superfamily hydrolase (TIGR01509 family)